MELTLNDVEEKLSTFISKSYIKSNTMIWHYHNIENKIIDFKENYIYLLHTSLVEDLTFPDFCINLIVPDNNSICDSLLNNPKINIICISQEYDVYFILKELEQIFISHRKVNTLSSKLLSALSKGASLQQILDLSSEIIENPILLLDISTSVISYSNNNNAPNDPAWKSHITNGYVIPEYYKIYEEIARPKYENATELEPIIIEDKMFKHRILLYKAMFKNNIMSFIEVLEYNRTFREDDKKLLSIIGEAVALTLHQKNCVGCLPKSSTDSFLMNLLSGGTLNKRELLELTKNLNITSEDKLFTLCIDLHEFYGANSKIVYMKKFLEYNIPNNYGVIFEDKIVLLLILKKKRISDEEILHIKNLLEEKNLIGGLSRKFNTIKELYPHFQQCINSIEIGSQIHSNKHLYQYADYMPYHLIKLASNNIDLTKIYLPELMGLLSYDHKNNSQFTLSLYYYLQNNLNLQKTSEILHIHYNTLKYRLKKIEDMYTLDIDNMSVQLSLQLSFIVLEYINRMNFIEYVHLKTNQTKKFY